MLSKFTLRAAVTAAALTFPAGNASAEQFQILVMDHAFFPEISFLQPGDEVVFVNLSGASRDIIAEDESWAVTGLADGAEASLIIAQGMPNKYKVVLGEDAGDMIGTMNFSGQPGPAAPAGN